MRRACVGARSSCRAAAVMFATVLLSACGGGPPDGPDRRDTVSAEKLCGGAFSREASLAVETVTGAKEFAARLSFAEPRTAADAVVAEYSSGGAVDKWRETDLCEVHVPDAGGLPDLEIGVSLSEEEDLRGVKPSFVKYAVGRQAISNGGASVVYFDCASQRFPEGVGDPVLMRAELTNRRSVKIDPEELRQANLKILASASRAFAGALRCEGGAGLAQTAPFTRLS